VPPSKRLPDVAVATTTTIAAGLSHAGPSTAPPHPPFIRHPAPFPLNAAADHHHAATLKTPLRASLSRESSIEILSLPRPSTSRIIPSTPPSHLKRSRHDQAGEQSDAKENTTHAVKRRRFDGPVIDLSSSSPAHKIDVKVDEDESSDEDGLEEDELESEFSDVTNTPT